MGLAIISDYPEENWIGMNLCAQMLFLSGEIGTVKIYLWKGVKTAIARVKKIPLGIVSSNYENPYPYFLGADNMLTEVKQGHYAKKQILCKNQIIAWSHSSRFTKTRSLLEKYARSNSKLLDYGCGDGTFLTTVRDLFPQAVGCDITPDQINDCQTRLSEVLPKASFRLIDELNEKEYDSYFDIAVCMEVVEHCLPDSVDGIISNLKRLVKPGGIILISVPIEIGPTLPLKQITRAAAGWLRQGDYRGGFESYKIEDLWTMMFATKSTSIERNIYKANSTHYYGHHGFNWRSLREQLSQQFDIETTTFSPLGWLGGFVSSQVFIICRNRKN